MTIAYFGASSNPTDGAAATLDDTAARPVTPPASMVTGDLVVVYCLSRDAGSSFSNSVTGGQSWTSGTLRQSNAHSLQLFWCRYNGTWAANPEFRTAAQLGTTFTIAMAVFRPTTGTNTWAIDIAETTGANSAPVSPFNVTATPGTPTVATHTVSLIAFISQDDNTWTAPAGWSTAGSAQYRNIFGNDTSLALYYKINTSAATTVSPATAVQATNGGDVGRWLTITFKEQSSGVTLANIGDEVVYDGETEVTIDYAGGSATGNVVTICSANNIADASAVTQTVTTQGATQLKFTAALSTFSYWTDLYVFVTNDSAQSNSSGYVIQRMRRMQLTVSPFKSLAEVAAANLTNIQYQIYATDLTGTLVLSGAAGTTDGSGVFTSPVYETTSGGALSGGGDVTLVAFYQGASQAASKGTAVQLTPTYL